MSQTEGTNDLRISISNCFFARRLGVMTIIAEGTGSLTTVADLLAVSKLGYAQRDEASCENAALLPRPDASGRRDRIAMTNQFLTERLAA